MFNSKIIKTAWKIRKEAAKKYTCKVANIAWKICLSMAINGERFIPRHLANIDVNFKEYHNVSIYISNNNFNVSSEIPELNGVKFKIPGLGETGGLFAKGRGKKGGLLVIKSLVAI